MDRQSHTGAMMKLIGGLLSAFVVLASASSSRADDFEVTVVAILASDRHKEIEPKLKPLAEEIRKKDDSLTGWKVARQSKETLHLNEKHSFRLIDDISADVTIVAREDKDKEKDKRIRVNVKSPHSGEIIYSTVPDKFFPVLTRYQTDKDKERLVYAVMVKILPPK
jgi:hypothetical protein